MCESTPGAIKTINIPDSRNGPSELDVCSPIATQKRQARSYGVAKGGKCHPWTTGRCIFDTPENSLALFIFVAAKERSPKILVEINLGLCSIQENSTFAVQTLYT